MQWFSTPLVAIAMFWVLAAFACIALVAINPADPEEDLWQDYLRDGFDAEPTQLSLDFEPTRAMRA